MIEKKTKPEAIDSDETPSDEKALISSSIIITGDISGKEDIVINGSVEGTIDFREHNVLIGKSGRVNANVIAKTINVDGEVKGELRANEQVTINPSGRLIGDIRAPRVVLSDGCQFKGSVDMEDKSTLPSGEIRSGRLPLKSNRPYKDIPNTTATRKP
ncbi:MAG: hypothetical protein GKR96_10135 [Gammaproteobacteria bacterium]|nr:hypothetical protein [Gammaproteobacteria bacterium]